MTELERIIERARELGQMLGRTSEYRTLRRAREQAGEDEELGRLATRLAELDREMVDGLRRGEEPGEEARAEHDALVSRLQSSSLYQSLVAAESNFEKVVTRVNEAMSEGMESGGRSGIILPG